jgi:hypothetical protein
MARFGFAPAIVTDNIVTRKNNANCDIMKGWILLIPDLIKSRLL